MGVFNFVATLFFEYLRDRLKLRHMLGPRPFSFAKPFFEFFLLPLEFEVSLGEPVRCPILLGANFHIF